MYQARHRLYRAGHALGQLLRTVHLCDYFTLPDFRRSIYQVLERGESVRALQRQIITQALPPKRGRRAEELIATSGALTLAVFGKRPRVAKAGGSIASALTASTSFCNCSRNTGTSRRLVRGRPTRRGTYGVPQGRQFKASRV